VSRSSCAVGPGLAANWTAQGLNNRQIADRMQVSVNIVAFYMRQVFRKLDIG